MDSTGNAERSSSALYWSGGHTKHRLLFHLVFTPKYRARVLDGEIAKRLRELLVQACNMSGWQIHELGIQSDHLHLLLQISPREPISDVVQKLKGGTSRVLRLEYPDLEEFLWGKSFWGEGYFVESIGEREESIGEREESIGEREESIGEREESIGEREESIGEREESVIRRYIAKQREPINPEFEQ